MKQTNEVQQMTEYKELSRELSDMVDGRWQFVFHYGKLEVWDRLTRESIFICQEDIPRFQKVLNYLEKK